MKLRWMTGTGLLLGGALVTQLSAATANDGNPYGAIAGRNAFGLKPPAPVNSAPTAPPAPAAKIFLQGITTLLGQKQVFLKVQPNPPGKESSTVLSEGQREESLEVIEINPAGGIVRIKYNDQERTLTMEKDAATPTGVAPAAAAPPGGAPGLPGIPGAVPRPSLPGMPTPPQPTTTGINMPTRSLRSQNATPAPPSFEEQTIMMEVQREITKKQVDAGTMPPLPPTDITHLMDEQMPPTPR